MQALALDYFSAEQVKQMLQLFTFDQCKLSIAKSAYSY